MIKIKILNIFLMLVVGIAGFNLNADFAFADDVPATPDTPKTADFLIDDVNECDAMEIGISGVKLGWDKIEDATEYEVELENMTNPSQIFSPETTDEADSPFVLFYGESGLSMSNEYRWHVRAINAGFPDDIKRSRWSGWCKFGTETDMLAPLLLYPSTNVDNVSTTVTLKWSSPDGVPDGVIEKYDIIIKDLDDDDITIKTSTSTSKKVNLDENTNYKWSVIGYTKNRLVESEESLTRKFKTGRDDDDDDDDDDDSDDDVITIVGECFTDDECDGDGVCYCANVDEDVKGLCAPAGSVVICPPTTHASFTDLVNSIIDFIYTIALVIAPIMFIVAGFTYITSIGEPAKIKKAYDIAFWTAVGLLIVLLSKGIIIVIKDVLG